MIGQRRKEDKRFRKADKRKRGDVEARESYGVGREDLGRELKGTAERVWWVLLTSSRRQEAGESWEGGR